MGVTLERVQNKFACIIGELCSEPVILSKFAIWLDLRLAEYKAKGAISLDGFGENPDPGWLKGHEKLVSGKDSPGGGNSSQSTPMHHSSDSFPFPEGGQENSNSVDEDTDGGRLSPDVVVVKEEVTSEVPDIFPVSLHRITTANLNRKRNETVSRSHDPFSPHSPPKVRRLSESTSADNSANQSLMSIIRETDDKNASNVTDSSYSVVSSPDQHDSLQTREDNPLSFSHQDSLGSGTFKFSSMASSSADNSSSLPQITSFQSHGSSSDMSLVQEPGQSSVRNLAQPTCPVCRRTFVSNGSLRRHVELHIPNSKRFACSICGIKFRRMEHVRSHLRSVHPLEFQRSPQAEKCVRGSRHVPLAICGPKMDETIAPEVYSRDRMSLIQSVITPKVDEIAREVYGQDRNSLNPNVIIPKIVEVTAPELDSQDRNSLNPNAITPMADETSAPEVNSQDRNPLNPNAITPTADETSAPEVNSQDRNPLNPNAITPTADEMSAPEVNSQDRDSVNPNVFYVEENKEASGQGQDSPPDTNDKGDEHS